jgi:hypothetical protein
MKDGCFETGPQTGLHTSKDLIKHAAEVDTSQGTFRLS